MPLRLTFLYAQQHKHHACSSQPSDKAALRNHFIILWNFRILWNLGSCRKRKCPTFSEKISLTLCGKFASRGDEKTRGLIIDRGGGRLASAHNKLQLVCLLSARWPLSAERRVGCWFFFFYLSSLREPLQHSYVCKFAIGSSDVCVRDAILGCKVFCGSQQNEDGLCCRELWQGGSKEGESRGGSGGHWFVSSSDTNPPFAWPRTSEHASPHSLLPLVVFSFLCLLEIRESVWSLTPVLFEMKEEMTLSICAYFPLLWITHPEITLFTPHFFLIIHWFTAKWRIHGLIRVALAKFFFFFFLQIFGFAFSHPFALWKWEYTSFHLYYFSVNFEWWLCVCGWGVHARMRMRS